MNQQHDFLLFHGGLLHTYDQILWLYAQHNSLGNGRLLIITSYPKLPILNHTHVASGKGEWKRRQRQKVLLEKSVFLPVVRRRLLPTSSYISSLVQGSHVIM